MSAPMDESDSDSDAPQNRADDDLQYPVEGLFKSHEERARIMSMREIEREQILAERREENERIRQNRMLRQLKVNQEKDSKKRKAGAADLEDAARKSSRARTKAEAREGFDRWAARHPSVAAYLQPADTLVDGMRGRSSVWYRIRVNLEHVPEPERPPQEPLEVDYNPWEGVTWPDPRSSNADA